MPVIDRHIINPNINYDGASRDDLFRLINRWKRLLIVDYNVQPGQTLALGIFDVNLNHIACLFAAAELSLKIFIITKPIAKETIHATKMGIFGPVDITVSQNLDSSDLHVEMFERYSRQICYESEIEQVTNDNDVDIFPSPDDHLIFASTSGTTANSKPVLFTHREVYEISKRNAIAFGYTKDSVVQQTVNMHHASAMLTYLFPTLMTCDTHYVGSIAFGPHLCKRYWTPRYFVEECLVDNKVDNIICSNFFLLKFLIMGFTQAERLPEHRIRLNMSGFPATEEIYEFAKQYPIDFISHYGSIDTGIPLLINHITENSVYDHNYIGTAVDDFYRIDDNNIWCDLWSDSRPLPDQLLLTSKGYYYQGRNVHSILMDKELYEILDTQVVDYEIVLVNNKLFLVVWNKAVLDITQVKGTFISAIFSKVVHLNKEDFMIDTKVSMEQLRAYLEYHYAVQD